MPSDHTVRVTFGGESVLMQWNRAQASAQIRVDGRSTGYQTADARHRTPLAVALVASRVWPEEEWPSVRGSIGDDWGNGCKAWEDLSYETVEDEDPDEKEKD